jgi:hypothetical protein
VFSASGRHKRGGPDLRSGSLLFRQSLILSGSRVDAMVSNNCSADSNDKRLPEVARACIAALGTQLRMLYRTTRQPRLDCFFRGVTSADLSFYRLEGQDHGRSAGFHPSRK